LQRRLSEQRRNMMLLFETRCAAGARKHNTLSYFHTLVFVAHTPTLKISRSLFIAVLSRNNTFLRILSKAKFSSVFPGKWKYIILEWKRRVSSDPFPNEHFRTKFQSLIFNLRYLNL